MRKPKPLLLVIFLMSGSMLWAQRIITSKLTDNQSGVPLGNVSVIIKGASF